MLTPTDIIFVLEYARDELFNYIVANGRMAEPKVRRSFQQSAFYPILLHLLMLILTCVM